MLMLPRQVARILARSAVVWQTQSAVSCTTFPRAFSTTCSKMAANTSKVCITAPGAPAAIGPYSHAVQAGGMLYVSGQVGMDAATGNLVPGGIEKETEQALNNLGRILQAAGSDYKHVVKATVLLADMADFQTVNQIYARFFPHDPPARAAYQVAALPKNARIEIEAIAVVSP